MNPYGWSKLIGEQVLRDISRAETGLEVAVLRYLNPVGAHPSGLVGEDHLKVPSNLMPLMARVAAGTYPALKMCGEDYPTVDGTGVTDFIHVMDLADAHVVALEAAAACNAEITWNVGRGHGVSARQIVAVFERVTGERCTCSGGAAP